MVAISREEVRNKFNTYLSRFDQTDEAIRLKLVHSFKVGGLCACITESLGLPRSDVDLVWLIGLLHDIGRFEQVRRYHTFVDGHSMDHAGYGASYLFSEGQIRDFLSDDAADDIIREAVGQHSAYRLEVDLTERQRLFCQIVRDADKIDIFRVYAVYAFGKKNMLHVNISDLETSAVSEPVMEAARRRKAVPAELAQTTIDFYVGMLCLYFELVYPISPEIVREQGNYRKLLAVHSRNEETEERLNELHRLIGEV